MSRVNDTTAFFLDLGERSSDKWSLVDSTHLANLWKLFRSDVSLYACRSLLQNRLLGFGVMFTNTVSKQMPSQMFYEHVQSYYVQFCKDFLDSLWVQGIVPYTIVPGSRTTNGLPYPRVLPPGRYLLETKEDTYYRTRYRTRPNSDIHGDSEQRHKVFFFVDNDVDTSSNRVMSALSNVFRLHMFSEMIERNTSFAESVRSRPPVITRNKTDATFDERDIAAGGVDGLRAQNASRTMQLRNRVNVEQYRQQQKLANLLNSGRVDTASTEWQERVDPVTGLPVFDAGAPDVYVPDLVPLPMDAEPVRVELPQSRSDLVAIQKHVVNQTCMAMGVPPLALTGGSSGTQATSGNAQLTDNVINFTLMRLRFALAKVLTDVYKLCHARTARVGEKRPAVSVDGNIGVIFPSLQRPETIRTLHAEGTLTYEAYKKYIATALEVDCGDFENKNHPRSKSATYDRNLDNSTL